MSRIIKTDLLSVWGKHWDLGEILGAALVQSPGGVGGDFAAWCWCCGPGEALPAEERQLLLQDIQPREAPGLEWALQGLPGIPLILIFRAWPAIFHFC